jgi:hypothetical protein
MHDGPRSSRLPFARRDRAAWLPLVFVGAIMFWTVALGLGGWSFVLVNDRAMEMSAVATPAMALEPKPGAEAVGGAEAIPVQMEESQESEDVNDNATER